MIDYRDGTGLTLSFIQSSYQHMPYRLKAILAYIVFQRLYTFNQQLMISMGVGDDIKFLENGFARLFGFVKGEFMKEVGKGHDESEDMKGT